MYDTVIVGGGTAGLSAALVLGRARRRVLLVSDGPPRNAPSEGAHGFFTRDGTPPFELLRIGREQLEPYTTVELRETAATRAGRDGDGFTVTLATGEQIATRTVVLATGVADELPAIPGFAELWGRGIYHCPYCHGWEVRDQPLGVYASGEMLTHLAPLIRNWSPDVTILSDGPDGLSEGQLATLQRLSIKRCDKPIERLKIGPAGALGGVVFQDGHELPLDGIFARTTLRPHNALAQQLGCELVTDGPIPGLVKVEWAGQTTVPGIYAAGDLATPFQQVVAAAASGATVAAFVNSTLIEHDVHAAAAG